MLSMGARVLALVAVEHGLVAPWHAGSSLTRNGMPAPFIGRWTSKHWTTRKSLNSPLLYLEAKQYSVNLLRTPTSKSQGA